MWAHPSRSTERHDQPAEAQGAAFQRWTLRCPEMQAVHGRQEGQRRHCCAIETEQQGRLTNHAIRALNAYGHVANACRSLPEQREGLRARSGRRGDSTARIGQGTAVHIRWQGSTPRVLARRRHQLRGEQHVACTSHAGRQTRVGIQCSLGLRYRAAQLLVQRGGLWRGRLEQAANFLQIGQRPIRLRGVKWHR